MGGGPVLALKVFKIKTLETPKVRLKVPNWPLTWEGLVSRNLKSEVRFYEGFEFLINKLTYMELLPRIH